jgi:hypothetical protein
MGHWQLLPCLVSSSGKDGAEALVMAITVKQFAKWKKSPCFICHRTQLTILHGKLIVHVMGG